RATGPSPTHPTRRTPVGAAILYLVLFALAVQFSDFKATRYHLPAYPFLFFLVVHSLARCQDLVPLGQRKTKTAFLASAVLLALGTHVPLLSLDRPGFALSAKGYSYAFLPWNYLHTHAPAGSGNRKIILELVQRPLLSDTLPKLSLDDHRELSRSIALTLAEAAPLKGQAKEFSRFERSVPPGLDRY